MKKILCCLVLILTIHASLFPLCGFSFMEFGGSRSLGMGEAYTAVSGDISCVYHNPAGLAVIETPELNLNLGSFYQNNSLGSSNGMVFTWPKIHMGPKKLTVHWNNYQVSDRTIQQAGFSYSKIDTLYNRRVRWGTTMKWRSDSFTSLSGFLLDAGIQSDFVQGKVSGGFSIKNLLSDNSDFGETAPSWGVLYHSPYGDVSGDFAWNKGKYSLNTGWENHIYEGLMLVRLGILTSNGSYFTTGLSSHLWPIGFDVSFSYPINSTDGSGYFQAGLRYKFGGASFSESYLDRSIDKAAALETEIAELRKEKTKLAKEILLWEAYKTNPTVDMLSLPGLAEELLRKPLPKKEEKKEVREAPKREAPKVIMWPQRHRVVPGDTLRSLAEKYYGDANKWQLIYNANTGKIERGQPRLAEELSIPKAD